MKYVKLFEKFLNENVSNSEILDLVDNIQALIQKIKAGNKSKGSKLFTIAGPLVKELHSLMESVENNDDIIFENEIAQKRGENSAKMRDVQQKIKEIQQSISELKQDEVDPRKIMLLQLGIQKETLKKKQVKHKIHIIFLYIFNIFNLKINITIKSKTIIIIT